jgi:hypothetical protein
LIFEVVTAEFANFAVVTALFGIVPAILALSTKSCDGAFSA